LDTWLNSIAVGIYFENYSNYTDMSKSIGLRGLERIHLYAC
jgi:hypothetical protein